MRRSGEGPDQRTLAPAGCGSKPGDAGRSIPKSMSPVSAGKALNAPALRQHRQVGQRAERIPGTSLGEPPRDSECRLDSSNKGVICEISQERAGIRLFKIG